MRRRVVRLPPEVLASVRALHPERKLRIRNALDRLLAEPDAGKELKGDLAGWRSLRLGRLRIVYRATRTTIDVAAIGPRSTIYLDAARLTRAKRTVKRAARGPTHGRGKLGALPGRFSGIPQPLVYGEVWSEAGTPVAI
jgi:mRNA-degrading endonuclease RelE of RelBE toxin-antitoxin system